jgi:hypothetical protein
VTAGFGDVPRVVVVVGDLVPGDHRAGCERVGLVERVDPSESRVRVVSPR